MQLKKPEGGIAWHSALCRMQPLSATIARSLALVAFCLSPVVGTAGAQNKTPLPVWKPNADIVEQLDEVFVDSRISIRPPRSLQKADRPNPPEMTEIGVYNYGWTPGGAFPSLRNLSIVLTPFARPSSDALDKTVAGMKKSIQEKLKQVEFREVEQGEFQGIEARAGSYTAAIEGVKVIAFYLVGIDKTGSFAVTAMLPQSEATLEEIRVLKASILTFKRAK